MTNQEFIKSITPIIVKEAFSRGYYFPAAIIAQACLESNYGRSGLAKYNNLFGMKCGSSWKGGSVNMKTKEEYTPGVLTEIKDNFRTYPTLEEGVKGYFDFISAKRYENLKMAKDTREYLELIRADGYATSTKYVDSVMGVVNKYELEEYNTPEETYKVSEKVADNTSIRTIALDVIAGKYGNGAARRIKLHRAGYNYNDVQAEVNKILRGNYYEL